jgi:predicted kinase
MQKTINIIRGLPGSGKSTYAETLGVPVFEADQYFIQPNGEYHFDGANLRKAHEWCQSMVREVMKRGTGVAVANTFTQEWEVAPYRELAEKYGYTVVITTIHSKLSDEELAARNVHGVPAESIRRMRERWELMV